MNRRGFLGFLGLGGAALIAEPARKYFFAPVGGWRSDVIANPNDMLIPIALPREIELGGAIGNYQPDGGIFFHGMADSYVEEYRLVRLGGGPDRIVSREEYNKFVTHFMKICEPKMREVLIGRVLEQERERARLQNRRHYLGVERA